MTTEEPRKEMTEHMLKRLKEGFDTSDQILQDTVEWMSDEYDAADVEAVSARALQDAIEQHRSEQACWPAVTDCDRLDAAFEELNALGIMARHHFACCSNCAQAEMPDEFDRIGGKWEGKPIWGYTYYHQQNTESAAEDGGLYLGYGSTEPADDEAQYEARCIAVARKVLDVLAAHGLKSTWNGTYAKKPCVQVKWQRRARPARFCGDAELLGGCG